MARKRMQEVGEDARLALARMKNELATKLAEFVFEAGPDVFEDTIGTEIVLTIAKDEDGWPLIRSRLGE